MRWVGVGVWGEMRQHEADRLAGEAVERVAHIKHGDYWDSIAQQLVHFSILSKIKIQSVWDGCGGGKKNYLL